MDISTLVVGHYVLSLGCVREASRVLDRPVSSISDAFSRLQSYIAKPLTTMTGRRLTPTLEGRRLSADLQCAADLIVEMISLAETPHNQRAEQVAAQSRISLLSLFRFITVVHSGSIRSAALKIGIGQPQLTRQIRKLETELGVELLSRAASGTVPTPAGQRLVVLVQELETRWQRIFDRAGERFRRVSRTIRLGSVAPLSHESRIAKILALLAARWLDHMPRSPIFISSSNAEELLSGLNNRQYDLVLLDTAEMPSGVEHCVVLRSNLALVGKSVIINACKDDLKHLLLHSPIALPSLKSGLRQRFTTFTEEIMRPDECANLTCIEVDSIPVIANLVIEHDHIALLPQWALGGIEDQVQAIVLPERFSIQLSLAWGRHGNTEAAAMAKRILMEAGYLGGESRRQ